MKAANDQAAEHSKEHSAWEHDRDSRMQPWGDIHEQSSGEHVSVAQVHPEDDFDAEKERKQAEVWVAH